MPKLIYKLNRTWWERFLKVFTKTKLLPPGTYATTVDRVEVVKDNKLTQELDME